MPTSPLLPPHSPAASFADTHAQEAGTSARGKKRALPEEFEDAGNRTPLGPPAIHMDRRAPLERLPAELQLRVLDMLDAARKNGGDKGIRSLSWTSRTLRKVSLQHLDLIKIKTEAQGFHHSPRQARPEIFKHAMERARARPYFGDSLNQIVAALGSMYRHLNSGRPRVEGFRQVFSYFSGIDNPDAHKDRGQYVTALARDLRHLPPRYQETAYRKLLDYARTDITDPMALADAVTGLARAAGIFTRHDKVIEVHRELNEVVDGIDQPKAKAKARAGIDENISVGR